MAIIDLRKQTGVLQQAIEQCTKQALACGALQPIKTTQLLLTDCGVEFLVRSVSSLTRKERAERKDRQRRDPDNNPFLPPEPELTVGYLSDSHLAVLNKFNVIDQHLLIVTRRFEHQETLLTDADFRALWRCLWEVDGLGFYNGGAVAGASQRHKHLQLIPLPLAPGMTGIPMDGIWSNVSDVGKLISLPALPFPHIFLLLPAMQVQKLEDAAAYSYETYHCMLKRAGLNPSTGERIARQSAPYNLLLTRRWMLLVPRSKESYERISVNALGFAGSLFVRNQLEMGTVKRLGPMEILKAVTPDATIRT